MGTLDDLDESNNYETRLCAQIFEVFLVEEPVVTDLVNEFIQE